MESLKYLSTFAPISIIIISIQIMIFLSDVQGFLTSLDIWDISYILLLAVFLGIEVISHVPAILHTPLMSGANAIHGVVIIGSIIVMGHASPDNYLALGLGFLAVVLGTLNVVGGFVVTNRMLQMFKKKK
jgi:H+-translocating NAD(P) transhydrogenase subunit alpha